MSEESFVYTACPGWGDHEYCALKTIVKDGKIIRTEPAEYTGAEVVQVIGTKFVLYRESHSKPREKRIQLVKPAKKRPQ